MFYGEPVPSQGQNVVLYREPAPGRAQNGLVGWLAGWLVDWLAGLVGWAGWLVPGWLAGWLVGWLAGFRCLGLPDPCKNAVFLALS